MLAVEPSVELPQPPVELPQLPVELPQAPVELPQAPVEESVNVAPAPQWLGMIPMLLGGSLFTVSTGYGAFTSFCFECGRIDRAGPLRDVSVMVGGGVLATLAGMTY